MLKGFKTQLSIHIFFLLFLITVPLNAGWLEIKFLHNNKTYINNNTINVNIKTRELIALQFIVHYTNTSPIDDYICWVEDGYYGDNRYKYQFPSYAHKWEDKEITLSPLKKTVLENIVYIQPTQTSRDTVMIWYGERANGVTISKRWQRLIIDVSPTEVDYPEIEIEPEFTPGLSNTITWYPIKGSMVQDVYYFDDADPFNLKKAAQGLYKNNIQNTPRNTVFENLLNGHKYGYFARSEIITENDTLYMCSDFTYSVQDNTPPARVTVIHADPGDNTIKLTWQKVGDDISEVEKYIIFRKMGTEVESPVDTVLSEWSQTDIMSWIDLSFEKGKYIYYRVRGVDRVGNMGQGVKSNSVFVAGEDNQEGSGDGQNNSGSPELTHSYTRGPVDTLWIELSLEDTVQALRFESVRDSIQYFDSNPTLPMRYFDSGWIDPEVLRNQGWVSENNADKVFFVFDYTDTQNAFMDNQGVFHPNSVSEHIDANFVNDHTYIRRIQRKYNITQNIVWLEDKKPDCFPPNDIRNLIGELILEDPSSSNSDCYVKLHWQPAQDKVSGVKRYHLYRKIEGMDQQFVKQATVTSPEFIDTVHVFSSGVIFNPLITYKVSSEDYVGNIREIEFSDWEFQERSLQGPEIIFTDTGSDKVFPVGEDTLFTQEDSVSIGINKFNISDVLKYEINVNNTITVVKNENRNINTFTLNLPEDEIAAIKIRAGYLGNVFSMWSDPLIAIRNLNRPPENFKAVNDSTDWEGDIKLSWNRASLDIKKYEIFRNEIMIGKLLSQRQNIIWKDRYGMDEWKNESGDTLTVYQDYAYTIRSVNIFGEKSAFTPAFTTYCNRAPEIIVYEKKIENNNYIVSIGWRRAFPSQLQEGDIKYRMNIYQDSLTNLFRKVDIIKNAHIDTIFEDFIIPSKHNYIFRIKEIPNLSPQKPSAWSKPYTVPDFSLFDSLESLALPGKRIFVNWNNSELIKKFKIDSFAVSRSVNEMQEKSWLFPSDIVSLIDSSDNLTHGTVYTYTVKAIDSLGQILDEKAVTDTCDSVAFIPDIDQDKTPEYFNQNSVEIFWKWINDIQGTDMLSGTEGADSLAIQLSISNDFPSFADQTVMTDYFKADSNRSRRVQIPKLTSRRNEKLFIRINAKDKWGHNAISSKSFWWSSDFYPLKTTIYDTVPSPKVTDFRVRNNGSFNYNSDSILVYCTWTGAGVEQGTVDTNRTILWNAKFYRIRGQWNEEQVVLGEVSVQKDKENYVFEAPVLNRYFRWQVDVIDSAGNITQGDLVDTENYLETPPPPHPLDYKMCLVPEIESAYPLEYYVEIALNPSHFSLAYQNDDIRERLLCQLGWTVNDTLICTSGWGSIKVDTTWFRLKIREKRSDDLWVESAWSPVVTFPPCSSEAKNLTQIETSYNTIQSFYLYPNKPNPFNNSTTVRYDIPEPSQVNITIYNMKGSLVKQFKKSRLSPGSYYLKWDGTDMYDMQVSSGIYICYFMAKTEQGKWWKNEIKMLLIK